MCEEEPSGAPSIPTGGHRKRDYIPKINSPDSSKDVPYLNGFYSPKGEIEKDGWIDIPVWWDFLVGRNGPRKPHEGGPEEAVFEAYCDLAFEGKLSTSEGFLPSRFSSWYDEDDGPLGSRKTSREDDIRDIKRSLSKEEKDKMDFLLPVSHLSLERSDSLLEAVLAAKKGGWNGLKRTESLESGASLASIASSFLSDCNCEDCFLGLSDKISITKGVQQRKKNSNWRKVRNVVQWTPFIQTYKRHKYPWVQLAGHQGNFKAGYKQGTIMKKLCKAEETAFDEIQKDVLKPFVPEYLGIVDGSDGEKYLQLQDLLSNFSSACVMDIKMGVRTYLEEELAKARHKPKLRKDMFDKMVQIDLNAPTEAEQRAKAVTKPRYMVWRETISSTATLGFRIEGIRRGDGTSSKDFKTTRTREQVMTAISGFIEGYPQAVVDYIKRLKEIKSTLEKSNFFKSHELIGSSLLFVHNDSKSGIWLIDFAKTVPLPDSVKITHTVPWVEGTHEDGYLIGFDNLVDLMECLHRNPPEPKKSKSEEESVTNDVNTSHDHCNSTVLDDTKEQRISNCNEVETLSEGVGKLSGYLSHEEVGEHTGGSPSLKTKSKNGNVTNVVERKVLNERKAN